MCGVFVLLYAKPVALTDLIDNRNTIPVELLADINGVERGVIDWLKKGLNPEVDLRFTNASQAQSQLLKAIQKEKQVNLAKELQSKPLVNLKQLDYKNPELLNVSIEPRGEIEIRYRNSSELKQYRSSTAKALMVNASPIMLSVGTSLFSIWLFTKQINVVTERIIISDSSLEPYFHYISGTLNTLSFVATLIFIAFIVNGIVKIINGYKKGDENIAENIKLLLMPNTCLIIAVLIMKALNFKQ